MITLIGSLIGFLGSAFPDFLKLFREHHDRKHELDILDRQITLMEKGHSQRLEEIQTLGDIQEAQSLHSHARPTGVPFIDGLAGSVRPIITYAFFLLYAAIKVAQLLTIQHLADQLTWTQALLQIWHMEDQALFATVMSFWFGQRALAKFGHKSK